MDRIDLNASPQSNKTIKLHIHMLTLVLGSSFAYYIIQIQMITSTILDAMWLLKMCLMQEHSWWGEGIIVEKKKQEHVLYCPNVKCYYLHDYSPDGTSISHHWTSGITWRASCCIRPLHGPPFAGRTSFSSRKASNWRLNMLHSACTICKVTGFEKKWSNH